MWTRIEYRARFIRLALDLNPKGLELNHKWITDVREDDIEIS